MRVAFITPFIWTNGVESGVPTVYRTIAEWAKDEEVTVLVPGHTRRSERVGRFTLQTFPLYFWRRFGPFDETKSLLTLDLNLPKPLKVIANKLIMLQFMVQSSYEGLKLGKSWAPNFWYGVTPYAVPAIRICARATRGKAITRLLGTFLGPLCEKPNGVWGRLRRWGLMLKRLPEVLAFRFAGDLLIITDDGTRGRAVAAKLGARNAHCLRNGVDLHNSPTKQERERSQSELRRELEILEDGLLAVYTGQLIPWKRLDRLVSAYSEVVDRLANPLTVVVVGDGTERDSIEQQVRSLGMEGNFRFVGAVQREEIPRYLKAADLFVAPHDLSCACNSTIEAMSYGTPVVATSFGDTRELIEDGIEGYLGDETYSRSYAGALELAIRDLPTLRRLGENARERIEREVQSWEERIKKEKALAKVLANGSSKLERRGHSGKLAES